jgi:small conductance mechanosensitive channel
MSVLFRQIQTSLLEILGSSIEAIPRLIIAFIIILFTRRIARICRKLTHATLVRVVTSQSLHSLILQTTYILIWIVGILIAGVTAFPSLRLGDILALFGLTSVAIGLIFQEIGKNFIAGALLLLQEPFNPGDQIIVEGFEGTIEEIGFRTTQILTYQGERILLPNSILFSKPVKILTAMEYRRTDLIVEIDYNTSVPIVFQVLLGAVVSVEGVLCNPAPIVDAEFGTGLVKLIVRYWTLPKQDKVLRTKTQVVCAINQAFEQAGIIIPSPATTAFVFDQQKFNGRIPRSTNNNITSV